MNAAKRMTTDEFVSPSVPQLPTPKNHKRGDVLRNRYELIERIARGGSANIFRALDRLLMRHVAIKVAYPRDRIQRARLIREARIGAQLHHAYLMPVLDIGIGDRFVYIVMPLVPGATLSARINAGHLPWQTTGIYVHHLLVGLAVLHGASVVHRDVKSDNCLLWHDNSGTRLILADFGLSLVDHSSLAGMPGHRTAEIIGSIGYMAPERIDSQCDARSDVYSAGVVLFECLTRRLPFRGQQQDVLWQHATVPPPAPSSIRSDLPREFDDIIATALAKKPEARFQTVGEFDAALLSVLDTKQVDVIQHAGVDHVARALQAYADSKVSSAIQLARDAEACDRQWRLLRELLEVIHESEQPPQPTKKRET